MSGSVPRRGSGVLRSPSQCGRGWVWPSHCSASVCFRPAPAAQRTMRRFPPPVPDVCRSVPDWMLRSRLILASVLTLLTPLMSCRAHLFFFFFSHRVLSYLDFHQLGLNYSWLVATDCINHHTLSRFINFYWLTIIISSLFDHRYISLHISDDT